MNVQGAAARGGKIHHGKRANFPSYVVLACTGRTMRGRPTEAPVTCKACAAKAAAR